MGLMVDAAQRVVDATWRLFASAGGMDRGPGADFWYNPVAFAPPAGMPVTEETAVEVPAVYDIQQILSRPVAHLPFMVFRRQDNGGKEPVPTHPVVSVLRRRPNERHTPWEFRGQMQWDLGLYNNAYAEIRPGPRGAIDQLDRLHPRHVRCRRLANETVVYEVRRSTGIMERLREDQVWHLRGLPLDATGLCGRPQIEIARQTIASALALMDYAGRFFANDAKSGAIIEYPHFFKDAEERGKWIEFWQRSRTGPNRHKDTILERGMTYKPTGATPEEAQFLQTRKQLWIELAEFWQVPPHMIGILDGAIKSNIEEQAQGFLTDTLLPVLRMWENRINQDLITRDDVFFAEFNVAGLLRANLRERYEAYARARQWGWLSVNEIRALENRNPIGSEGDEYLRPLNMTPLGVADRGRDARAAAQFFLECFVEQERRDLDAMLADQANGNANGQSHAA